MNKPLRVLIVEDSADDAELLLLELRCGGYDPTFERVDTPEAMTTALDKQTWDVILSDYVMPHFSGLVALELLKEKGLDLPFIVVSGKIGEDIAVEAMKAGAHDYIIKNNLKRLATAVERELGEAEVHKARRQAEKQAQLQLKRLTALRNIDMAITASLDLRVTLNVFLDQVTTQLGVDASAVLLQNPHTKMLKYAAGRGFRSSAITHTSLRLGEGHAGRAASERRTISIPNMSKTRDALARATALVGEDFIAYYGVPLIAKGQVKGVLEVFHRAPLYADQGWLEFLDALGGQAAIAIDNATLFDNLQHSNIEIVQAYDATLEGWVQALDLRDKETEGHTQRVVEATVHLARIVGITNSELVHVRRGALLHDIGKLGIPDSILLKPGPLTDEEWVIMRKHPVYAYEFLSPIAFLQPAIDIPYCHHEKWDGTGYPRGLKGEQIPLAARVFAVVDVWEALSNDRCYKAAWPKEKVCEHIRSLAGTHFDPRVVEAFLAKGLESA